MLGSRSTAARAVIRNDSAVAHTINLKVIIRGDFNAGTEFNSASGDMVAGGQITSSGVIAAQMGIAKTGGFKLTISNSTNSYTGPTAITAGTLAVIGTGILGVSTNSSLISVSSTSSSVLDLSGATVTSAVLNALPNAATLSLAGGGTVGVADVGYVILPAGNEVVAGLILGGVSQPAGTYGSSTSGATNLSNEYFSGSGTITVVPEPATAGLILVGAALTTRRRRRA